MMSQQNVDVVRAAWDAWLRGDLDGTLATYDPEIVWGLEHYSDWPEGEYRGLEGVRRFFAEWLDVWDEYEVRLEELIAAPDGRVVALCWQGGRGRHSGLPLEMKWAQIFTVKNGAITRIDNYDDRAEALEAVGLSR